MIIFEKKIFQLNFEKKYRLFIFPNSSSQNKHKGKKGVPILANVLIMVVLIMSGDSMV